MPSDFGRSGGVAFALGVCPQRLEPENGPASEVTSFSLPPLMQGPFALRSCMIEQALGTDSTKRKIFWLLFAVLSLGGWFLPWGWSILEMFVALFASWWLVYRLDII